MKMMSDSIIAAQRKAYGENFAEFGATPRGNYWLDIETQWLRFERLLRNLQGELPDSQIHDLGCGTCELHRYLLNSGIRHRYSGTEIVPEMISHATSEYPDIAIHNRDFLEIDEELHDFIFLSGMLNLKLATPEPLWREWSLNIIRKMFRHATRAIAFNFLTVHPTLSDPDLIFFDPAEMLAFCQQSLSRFVVIDTGYPLYECTVTVFKPEFAEQIYPQKIYQKYFV